MEHATRGAPKRAVAVGLLAAGVLAGAVVGTGLLTGAAPDPSSEPGPMVLHAAPALVRAGAPVDLTISTVCDRPGSPSCEVVGADVVVDPAGVVGAAVVRGSDANGVYRFSVPAELVPDDGFSYSFVLRTRSGPEVTYPPGGAASGIRVLTVAGLPVRSLAAFDWDDRAEPAEVVARLRVGATPAEIGIDGVGAEGGQTGPSSFDVAPDGSIVVADWVNARTLRFSATGRFLGQTPLPPGDPVDIAVADGGLVATTLGVGAVAFELDSDGTVRGRYPIGYGVTSRVMAGTVPRARVGNAQWIPVRSVPGAALTPEAQGRGQTATVPLRDGSVGVSEVVDGGLAFVWTRPDGSRGGVVLRLPDGVLPGADYLVQPLPDGGAIAVQGLWDPTHFGVAVIAFDAGGGVRGFTLLPEPTTRMASPFSTVRFEAPDRILMMRDDGDGMRIDRFEVS